MTRLRKRKRRILVVEPDAEFCAALVSFLEARRFEVQTAAAADESLKKAKDFKPDIVLLSRELPMPGGNHGPDGLRALKMMKYDRALSRTPVILASSEVGEEAFERYRKLKFSADDYIQKPFEDTELLRRIENLVGFDIADEMESLRTQVRDAMDDAIVNIFNADPEELGVGSAAARAEVAKLLEHVGKELDLPEEELELPPTSSPGSEPEAACLPDAESEIKKLRLQVQEANRKLEQVQKQLVAERKRARELKKEWKKKLQEIAARLQEKEEKEQKIMEQFEAMREKFADLELDHTMEIERIQAEKRRLEEELGFLREQAETAALYPPDQLAQDLKKIIEALGLIVERLEKEPTE